MKYVYAFKEGNASMRNLLGGKGANLAEMTKIGLPVPRGFTVTTEACNKYYEDNQHEYEQILIYYVYRYFLDAVYDYNVLLKMKGAAVGLLALKMMDVADWYLNGKKLEFVRQVDLAHLYSRQYEHSYYNYEEYNKFFMTKRKYSYENLIAQLFMLE